MIKSGSKQVQKKPETNEAYEEYSENQSRLNKGDLRNQKGGEGTENTKGRPWLRIGRGN